MAALSRSVGITPDLTTLGKIVGGGLPVGAYGGRAEIMDHILPAGKVFQAGTLSGNPLATAAGIATLKELRERPPYDRLEQLSARLASGLDEAATAADIPHIARSRRQHDDAVLQWRAGRRLANRRAMRHSRLRALLLAAASNAASTCRAANTRRCSCRRPTREARHRRHGRGRERGLGRGSPQIVRRVISSVRAALRQTPSLFVRPFFRALAPVCPPVSHPS